jgi:hypothetical protein
MVSKGKGAVHGLIVYNKYEPYLGKYENAYSEGNYEVFDREGKAYIINEPRDNPGVYEHYVVHLPQSVPIFEG